MVVWNTSSGGTHYRQNTESKQSQSIYDHSHPTTVHNSQPVLYDRLKAYARPKYLQKPEFPEDLIIVSLFHMFSFIAEEKNMAYDGYMLFFMRVNLYALINENE